ncbi:hypothetical protein Fot_37423 [Forsythia ovata]|uniref:Uncharacterized protein n=1 Tax=Forsythia ovata TaxID=205694 RepID=A0ABD1RZN7_9LAMI
MAFVLEVVVSQASEATTSVSSTVLSALGITAGIPSILPPEDIRRSVKKKMVVDDKEETTMPKRSTEDDGSSRDFRKVKRGWKAPSGRVEEHASHHSQGVA